MAKFRLRACIVGTLIDITNLTSAILKLEYHQNFDSDRCFFRQRQRWRKWRKVFELLSTWLKLKRKSRYKNENEIKINVILVVTKISGPKFWHIMLSSGWQILTTFVFTNPYYLCFSIINMVCFRRTKSASLLLICCLYHDLYLYVNCYGIWNETKF